LTPTKIRELSIVGSRGTFIVNYLTQDLAFYQNSAITSTWDHRYHIGGMSEGDVVHYAFPCQEPIRAEIEAFMRFIRDEIPNPSPPEEATATLALALDLIKSATQGRPVVPSKLALC